MSNASSAQSLDEGPVSERSDQRRGHPRFSVDLDVSLGEVHNFCAGFAENLSSGGAFVATHLLRPVGENVEVCIRLPDGSEVRGRGEVRWVRVFKAESDTPPGMGVRFLHLEPGSAQAIESFLGDRVPLFFDED